MSSNTLPSERVAVSGVIDPDANTAYYLGIREKPAK